MGVDYQGWRTGKGSRSEYTLRGSHRYTPYQVRFIALGYEAGQTLKEIADGLADAGMGNQRIADANPSRVRYIIKVCGGMEQLLLIYVPEWPAEKRQALSERYETEEKERGEKRRKG